MISQKAFLKRYKRRGYLHFDSPFHNGVSAWQHVQRFISGGETATFPFIGFELSTIRIRRATPPKGTTIPRRKRKLVYKTKKRPIKVASHRDAAVYTYYGMLLSERYEARLDELGLKSVPTAFRKVGVGRCNIHHAKEVFDFIEANRPCVALGFDVEKFFDTLSHVHLRNAWADVLGEPQLPEDQYRVFRALTRFAWVSRKKIYENFGISSFNPRKENSPTPRSRICSISEFRDQVRNKGLIQQNPAKKDGKVCMGIPQGSPMSAVLSNIYMLQADEVLEAWAQSIGGLYRRYCDDIVLVVPPEREATTRFLVAALLEQSKLKLNDGKTECVRFGPIPESPAIEGETFPYLGFVFGGSSTRLRQSSLDRYYGKMRNSVRLARLSRKKVQKSNPQEPLRTRKILLKYTHLARSQRSGELVRLKQGKHYLTRRTNFITYGQRAADLFESREIRKQIRGHWSKVRRALRR